MRSRSTEKFVLGAERLGISMSPTRRNTDGCIGNARCNFGCPSKAKMSVDVSYLPTALKHGARVISDALALKISVDRGRATGVFGRLLGPPDGRQGVPF